MKSKQVLVGSIANASTPYSRTMYFCKKDGSTLNVYATEMTHGKTKKNEAQ
jgi:hypothetical protein